MDIKLNCAICNKDFLIPHWRKETAKYCSTTCQRISLRAEDNTTCTFCGKNFHMKQFQKDRYNRNLGYYCSKSCINSDKVVKYSGDGNHQFGLKGELNASFKGKETFRNNHNNNDIYVYVPNHPYKNKDGRVLKHRLLIEENSHMFDDKFFIIIDGLRFLSKSYDVHHKDLDHDNNDISNLELLTRSEHTSLHNKHKKIIRDEKGRIKTTINI